MKSGDSKLSNDSGTRPRILVAEDEAVTALALEHTLLASGYDVCGLASTARRALQLARNDRPDLVVIDVRLRDGVSGHLAAREIQTELGIPVILISGHFEETCAREAGVVGFLRKPFGDVELLQTIEAVFETLRTRRPARAAPGLLVPNHFVGAEDGA